MVVCYPSNSTHIYQGLDVACFGIMKATWKEECMVWERETGGTLTKDVFLQIFSQAYIRAFTPDTVKSAFCKTGVWPLDRDVVSERDMAPSIGLSTTSTSIQSAIVSPFEPTQDLLYAVEHAEACQRSPTGLIRTSHRAHKRVQGEEHRDTLTSMHNLALTPTHSPMHYLPPSTC